MKGLQMSRAQQQLLFWAMFVIIGIAIYYLAAAMEN
jgi:hypothetical protein